MAVTKKYDQNGVVFRHYYYAQFLDFSKMKIWVILNVNFCEIKELTKLTLTILDIFLHERQTLAR